MGKGDYVAGAREKKATARSLNSGVALISRIISSRYRRHLHIQ
jgi:hypothetical protein